MKCVQLYYQGNRRVANRDVTFGGYFVGWTNIVIDMQLPVEYFKHRTWNHICWTYSYERNWHRIYINGELKAGKINVTNLISPVWKSSSKVENHAFVIGQEPDSIRGGYTIDQLFQGSINELNIWNVALDGNTIRDIATCKRKLTGNIKSWKIENLVINKALVLKGKDMVSMCNKKKLIHTVMRNKIKNRGWKSNRY